jgi:predicted lipoprotein with Yx(FWY)xxD motif
MTNVVLRRITVVPLAVIASAALVACGGQSKPAGGSSSASNSSSSSSGGYGAYGGSSGSSSGSTSSSSSTRSSSTLKLAKSSKGSILVDSRGFTAYLFTADHGDTNQCVKVKGCTAVWPPLTVKGNPSAGSGVTKSMLGTIKLANGAHQLTYAGHPLYGYTGDSGPASTSYIGATSFGGTWLAVSASGKAVH